MRLAIRFWKLSREALSKNPSILIPFIIVGLFDAFAILFLFLGPQAPLSSLFAPPVRKFIGEQYLHYPLNLILIQRLFNYAHIFVVGTIGVLMSALAISMLEEQGNGNKPSALTCFLKGAKRYWVILAIWLIFFVISKLIFKITNSFFTSDNKIILQIIFYLSFFLVSFIHVFFIYAIPAAVIEKRGIISSIKRGIITTQKNFLATLILVIIPVLFYIPVMILKSYSASLMFRLFPEVVLLILGIGIIVSVMVDCIVTCSTTILFLEKNG